MACVLHITGWHAGLKKVQMTKLIRAYTTFSLSAAKSVTDRVLSGEHVTIELQDNITSQALAQEMQSIGAIVEIQASTLNTIK